MDRIRAHHRNNSNGTHRPLQLNTATHALQRMPYRTIQSSHTPASATMAAAQPPSIPPKKLDKAVKMYEEILSARIEKELAARNAVPLPDPMHLVVPSPGSVTSRSSRAAGTYSRSVSEYDAATDISSVISFQGDEQPSQTNQLSFDGRPVKQSRRKRFDKVERLETALVRFLGACTDCNSRGVRCPLERHHDVKTLRRIIEEKRNRRISHPSRDPSSSTSGGSQGLARSPSGRRPGTPMTSHHDFLGLGAQLLTSGQTTPQPSDLQSPDGDVLEGIATGSGLPTIRYPPALRLDAGTELYTGYGHGAVFIVGKRLDDYYCCQHFSGCQQMCLDLDALQEHFELCHFSYTRIDPPIRHICSNCNAVQSEAWIRCYNCNLHDIIQTLVHGHFIRDPEIYYDPETGPAPLQYGGAYFGSAHASSMVDVEAGTDPYGGYGPDYDPTHYGDSQDSNPYGGTSDQGFSFNGNDDGNVGDGGNESSHTNYYRYARSLSMKRSALRLLPTKIRQHVQRLKHVLFLILSIIAIILYLTHDELIRQAQQAFPQAGPEIREHSLTIIFILLVISSVTLIAVKHRNQQPSAIASVSRRYRYPRGVASTAATPWAMLPSLPCPMHEKVPIVHS